MTSSDAFRARTLPATPAAPGMARRLLADILGSYPSGLVQDALMLTSELVTNAVRHGKTAIELRIHAGDHTVRVEVSDGSSQPPRLGAAQGQSESGRGLIIVAALATAWGTEPRSDGLGKTVWFELTHR